MEYLWTHIKSLDWKSPVVLLGAAAVGLFPLLAGTYARNGLIIGVLLCLSILIIFERLPLFLRKLGCKFLVITDILLSALGTWGLSTLFGDGLVLGISGVTCAILLSWALKIMRTQHERSSSNS